MKIRRVIRIVVTALIATASLPLLSLAAFHVWATGGPPSANPEWHVQWANIFITFWVCTLLLAVLVNLLLRSPEQRKANQAVLPIAASAAQADRYRWRVKMKLYPKTAREWQDSLFRSFAFLLGVCAVGSCVQIWRCWYSSLPFLPHSGWYAVALSFAIVLGFLSMALLLLGDRRGRVGLLILLLWAIAYSARPLVTECADVCWRLAYVRSEIAAQRKDWLASTHEVPVVTVGDQKDMPVFSVYYSSGMSLEIKGGLIIALWADGTLIYSDKDPTHGGPPFRKAQLNRNAVNVMMERIRATGVFSDPWFNEGQAAVDCSFQTICVRDGDRCVVMSSSGQSLYSVFRYMDWIDELSNYLRVWDELTRIGYQLREYGGLPAEVTPVFKQIRIR